MSALNILRSHTHASLRRFNRATEQIAGAAQSPRSKLVASKIIISREARLIRPPHTTWATVHERNAMSTHKPSVTRRRFLRNPGLTLAAAGTAPALSAPFVSRAMADTKTLTIIQWSHFVPEYDKWFDNFAKDWGSKNKIE